ncbi:MAG: hypothetical protein AB7U18_01125 [Dehalococcoidia bacterium]
MITLLDAPVREEPAIWTPRPVVVETKPARLDVPAWVREKFLEQAARQKPERVILPHIFRQPLFRRDKAGLMRQIPQLAGGAAGTWQFTNGGRTSLINGTFDIDSDTYKMALFLSTSDLGATETTYAGVTNEHANGNGYTTGGISITLTLSGTTTVTVDISSDPVWTASGGSIVARFAAIYEVSGNILCYCLLDSTPADVTATSGNTLTVAANASGVFTLA